MRFRSGIAPGYRRLAAALTAVVLTAPGCGPKPTVDLPVVGQTVEGLDTATKRISADPVRFLEETLAKSRKLGQFETHFQRQERLGLFAELKPLENILAEYRDDPFSVRFTWLDGDSEYKQCVYVHGENDNKVLLLPRKGLFGLPPSIGKYAAKLAVLFGKTRNPITDFGPRRLMERTLARIRKAKAQGEVTIKLLPPTEIGPAKEPCFHLEIQYPEDDAHACKLQDLYIHTQTRLPVATYLWLPGTPRRTEATLDAMYIYAKLTRAVELTDGHFRIDADKPPPHTATGSPPEETPSAQPVEAALSNSEPDE